MNALQNSSLAPSNSTVAERPKKHYRSIFLSDIHLGTRGCQADLLLEFLKNHQCDHLYLVGDIIDGWKMRSGIYWPQAHTNVLRRFLTLTKRGTRVTFVTGNHDEFLRRYGTLEFGNLRLVNETVHRSATGKALLVVHGDQFDVITRYHRWLAFLGDAGYTLMLQANTLLNFLRARLGYGYWSLSAYLKHRVKTAVSYISDFEAAVVRECHRQGYAGVVCGHIHHAEISDFDGVTYMNCGDWVESCTALVEDHGGAFRVVHWADERHLAESSEQPPVALETEPATAATAG